MLWHNQRTKETSEFIKVFFILISALRIEAFYFKGGMAFQLAKSVSAYVHRAMNQISAQGGTSLSKSLDPPLIPVALLHSKEVKAVYTSRSSKQISAKARVTWDISCTGGS